MNFQSINWDEFKSTESRSFNSALVFKFENIKEEEDFFKDSRPDFSLIKSFPALTWLTYLSEAELKEILGAYSAKELAVIWSGPKNTLDKLEKVIPESKVKLLKSYLEQVEADKDSEIFKQLISRTAKKLEEYQLKVA